MWNFILNATFLPRSLPNELYVGAYRDVVGLFLAMYQHILHRLSIMKMCFFCFVEPFLLNMGRTDRKIGFTETNKLVPPTMFTLTEC